LLHCTDSNSFVSPAAVIVIVADDTPGISVDVNTLPTSTHKVPFTAASLLLVTVIESIILEFTTTVASKAKALEGVVRVKITPAVVPFVGVAPPIFNVALLSILTRY
jgi:hypothetical protein